MKYKAGISIVIPTYNRKDQLENQITAIINQDISLIEEIIILDNHSSFDVFEIFNQMGIKKVRVVKNSFNVGACVNIMNAFLYCKTKWLWLLSDDDEVLNNSIETIHRVLLKSPKNTGMIKFSLEVSGVIHPKKDHISTSLENFIDYYHEDESINRGELVFMSNAVYNLESLYNHLGKGFEYAYTRIPYLVPVFYGLNDKSISVVSSEEAIVKYLPPIDGWWSFIDVGKGLSTLSHLPLALSDKYRRKFLDMTMLVTPKSILKREFIDNTIEDSSMELKLIYDNIFKYYLPFRTKMFFKLFILFSSNKLIRSYLLKLIKLKTQKPSNVH
jgi:glycosyltransferase involved in cell wall biosynthesis